MSVRVMLDSLGSLRSRALLGPVAFAMAVARQGGAPTPAYAMSPASPLAAPVLLQADDYYAPGDPQDVQVGVQGDDYADTDPSAMTDFRGTLDPHGQWVDDPVYGTIWVPNAEEVGPDFAPYVSNGGWSYDDDYVWNSYYDWGWVPFHYGRWAWVDSGRWGWIPGRRYAGAWVNWRTGADGYGYVGWGPAQPTYLWRGGVAMTAGFARPGPVVFCAREDLFARGVGAHVAVGARAAAIAADTHEYVRAEPIVAGRTPGPMHGPPPAMLGIRESAVVHLGPGERGVAQARAFARPSTAVAMGARPPSVHVVHAAGSVRPRPAPEAAPGRPAPRSTGAPRGGGGHRR
jgi:hypothetical protein